MNKNTHLWLIRLYAVIIAIVYFGGFLEGAAMNLVIALALGLIVVQSFLVGSDK